MQWIMNRANFWTAWALVVIMVAVASVAILLITLEAKVSYVRYRTIQRLKPKSKGKHRREKDQGIDLSSAETYPSIYEDPSL